MSDCACPKASSLTEIVADLCGVDLTQIQKIGFQRVGFGFNAADATLPADIMELADWQAFLTATDDSKIVITPFIGGNPTITAGAPITEGGGDNSTLNGVTRIPDNNPADFSTEFISLNSSTERALKALRCEDNLVVYFFLRGGKIAVTEVTAGSHYEGFGVQSLNVTDRNNAGFGTHDMITLTFSMPSGYSDYLEVITPNFNPLTEL